MGPEGNALSASPAHARQIVLDFPVIDNDELAKIVHVNADGDLPGYATHVVRGLYDVTGGAAAMRDRLEEIFAEVSQAISRGARFVVLSDRDSGRDLAPIPSLLLTAAVHHHLIREKTRTQVGLLVEAGDVREVHHVALLIGYRGSGGQPVPRDGDRRGPRPVRRASRASTPEKAVKNLIKALGKGVLKVMSKMGISTVASYRGAQVFEAIGLAQDARRPLLHRHRVAARRCRARRHRQGDGRAPRHGLPARRGAPGRTACSRSAGSTSGGARGSRTCSTPRRSSACSTRRGSAATTSSSSTPDASTTRRRG